MKSQAEKRAVEKLKSAQPSFGAFRAASAGTEKKWEEDEVCKAVAGGDIGRVMPDGTIYAGISPDTQQPLFALPADERLRLSFSKAVKYAKRLEAHGHKDWRVPTKEELNVLFENKEKGALAGTFNMTGPPGGDWYRSSTFDTRGNAWLQRFGDGLQFNFDRNDLTPSVRCIRSEPKP